MGYVNSKLEVDRVLLKVMIDSLSWELFAEDPTRNQSANSTPENTCKKWECYSILLG